MIEIEQSASQNVQGKEAVAVVVAQLLEQLLVSP